MYVVNIIKQDKVKHAKVTDSVHQLSAKSQYAENFNKEESGELCAKTTFVIFHQ